MQVCMHITSRRRKRMKMHMKTTSQSHHSIFRQTLLFPPVFSGLIIFSGLMFHFSTFCYISHHPSSLPPAEIITREKVAFAVGEAEIGCDVFSGRWVWDHLHRPLYEESECPYIDPQLTCREHGRPDTDYLRWRWQPHGCSLPSFNATRILESLRDKRMVFVGDSVNRGQFVSMVCLLHKMIPKSMTKNGSQNVFIAKDYNATIEFEWAPFLLESNKNIKNWKGVDIMVFNIHTRLKFNTPLERGLEEEGKDRVLMPAEEFYGMAIKNMIQWVKHNMDPNETRLFFTSISPSHTRSLWWGGDRKGNCYNETGMIQDPNYLGLDSSKINNIMSMMGEVLTKSKVPITFLNITQLSSYRKDAHTSIYKKQRRALTPEQIANPASYADCVHWCLPGLQDTWNELLFAKLFYP